jgi:hypothetical protein
MLLWVAQSHVSYQVLQELNSLFMPISSGKIVAPVSIDDVRTALGVSSNDLGYLCKNTHGKTNMWAKYKPVIYPSENINLTNSNWWKSSIKEL